ncbi:MAG TPA: hypothetical protein VKU19_27015 [Bryobacteraceae bacterium]|nr:hypothetical protein [Bryobacteraceae bacterium]
MNRTILAAMALASSAFAGPSLTTIQDVLYKADGSRFNGTLAIAWTSFQASDATSVAMQTTSVKVVNGNLRVQLVPTAGSTPPIVYSVTYNSDGRVQFHETWAVPASVQALRVSDVRVASSNLASSDTSSGSGTVEESDVVGLTADLSARPMKGPGFAPGGVAIVNATGGLETALGSTTDCVHVDGSSGPCGAAGSSNFVDAESPAGIVDGSNVTFALSAVPNPASSLALYRNGMLQKAGQDFTGNGQTVTFFAADVPQPGDTLLAWYRLSAEGDTTFVDSDVPAGTEDGANQQFALSAVPNPASSLAVFRNGLLQKANQDFTLSGQTLTFTSGATPQPGDTLLASYRLSEGGSTSSQGYPGAQVLCSGTGATTTATALSSMGTCSIPAGLLMPGDRVEVRFDLQHEGSASGFTFEMHWGGTVLAHRTALVSETMATGRVDAGITASGTVLSFQTWGAALEFAPGMAVATDPYAQGLTVDFQGMLSSPSTDTLSLTGFTVVRLL